MPEQENPYRSPMAESTAGATTGPSRRTPAQIIAASALVGTLNGALGGIAALGLLFAGLIAIVWLGGAANGLVGIQISAESLVMAVMAITFIGAAAGGFTGVGVGVMLGIVAASQSAPSEGRLRIASLLLWMIAAIAWSVFLISWNAAEPLRFGRITAGWILFSLTFPAVLTSLRHGRSVAAFAWGD